MSMIWGGELKSSLSKYTSAVVKSNIANKYGNFHYSIKAYASPALSDEEWELVFKAATELHVPYKENQTTWYEFSQLGDSGETEAYITENRVNFKKKYTYRSWDIDTDPTSILYNPTGEFCAMPRKVIDKVLSYIDSLDKMGTIETGNRNVECIDRFEKFVVREKDGLVISTDKQKENLLRYYRDDKTSSYTIYYDAKTMLPLLHIEDGKIVGWEHEIIDDTDQGDTTFVLRRGTVCYKWTRTVKYTGGTDDGIIGKILTIDAESFPGDYKIVGETYIKEQKTGKNQRYQFTIPRAQVSTDTSITLEAEGDPTTFSMSVDVLTPPSGDMIELRQFDVDDDELFGGTRITPQRAGYTHTDTALKKNTKTVAPIYNNEII